MPNALPMPRRRIPLHNMTRFSIRLGILELETLDVIFGFSRVDSPKQADRNFRSCKIWLRVTIVLCLQVENLRAELAARGAESERLAADLAAKDAAESQVPRVPSPPPPLYRVKKCLIHSI